MVDNDLYRHCIEIKKTHDDVQQHHWQEMKKIQEPICDQHAKGPSVSYSCLDMPDLSFEV
jgi:hypothetical protein